MNQNLDLSKPNNPSHVNNPPTTPTNTITIDEFLNLVQLQTAKVVQVESIPNKDKLYKITVEMGAETRTIVSGIKQWYSPEDLVGKTVAIVSNLAPKKLGGVESQGMLLGVDDVDGNFSILVAERPVKTGSRVR